MTRLVIHDTDEQLNCDSKFLSQKKQFAIVANYSCKPQHTMKRNCTIQFSWIAWLGVRQA